MRNKILSLLVLLLTAASGAWAKTDPNSVEWNNQTWSGWAESETTHTVGDITITCSGNAKAYEYTGSGSPLAMEAGNNDAITFTSNGAPFASISISTDDQLNVAGWTYNSSTWSYEWSGEPTTSVSLSGCDIKADAITFTFGTAEAPITVEWNPSTKTGTFSMPGSDVVLTPQYAPVAKWDVVENVEQLPAALEGIIAGEDKAIVTEGQSSQGTVMYAVTTTAEAAPALTAFSATVPTAKTYDDATTLYVWYYIQGHDTPDGQQATEENTFNDSEISATPLKVDILTNKFDLTLSPAPVKNITVTVAGQAKTPTDEGKVEAVKMQSEVKLKAATGYKFRKVEVKSATVPVETITLNKTTTTIYKVSGTATETLSVTSVLPDEATDKTVTWSSDNTAAATVDASTGVVTAVAEGTAHIRATANDGSGVYGECTVTVTDLSAYYSKMVECGCDNLDGKCANGANPESPFTGQVLSAAQAIALAQAKAAETSSNCAVFYGNGSEMGQIAFAKNDGTTGSARFYYTASDKGLSGYKGYYVSK